MANEILLEDGSSFLLMEDGVSALLTEDDSAGPSLASLSATLGSLTASLEAASLVPGSSAAAVTATLGSFFVSMSGVASGAAAASAGLSAASSPFLVSMTGMSSSAGNAVGGVSSTIESLGVSTTGTAGIPSGSVATISAILGSLAAQAFSVSGFSATLFVQLGPLTASAFATPGVALSAVGSLTASLGSFRITFLEGGTLLSNILQAIQDRVTATPDLVEALPGGFWTGSPDPEADDNLPYAVLTRIGGRTVSYVTSAVPPGAFIQGPVKTAVEDSFQVTLKGDNFDVLDRIHDLWEDNFHSRMDPLLIRRKMFRSLWNQEPTYDFGTVDASPEGANLLVYRWEFTVLTTVKEQ